MSELDKIATAHEKLYKSLRVLAAYAKNGDRPIESSVLGTYVDDLGSAIDEYVQAVEKSKSKAAG